MRPRVPPFQEREHDAEDRQDDERLGSNSLEIHHARTLRRSRAGDTLQMTDRVIQNDQDLLMLLAFLRGHKQPFTVSITAGKHRSTEQNRLQRLWVNEIAEQMAGTYESAEHVRGYCKLHIGVPILRNENEAFKAEYDKIVRPLPYGAKLKLMMVPFDFGVTRIMNTRQKKQYLDAVHKHFSEQGVILTDPEARVAA